MWRVCEHRPSAFSVWERTLSRVSKSFRKYKFPCSAASAVVGDESSFKSRPAYPTGALQEEASRLLSYPRLETNLSGCN